MRSWPSQPGVSRRRGVKLCSHVLLRFSILFLYWLCICSKNRKIWPVCAASFGCTLTDRKWKQIEKKEEKKGGPAEREWQKAAISCSLVLREHIYLPLISNGLVNFLSLFIACTCDLSLSDCGEKGNVQNGYFRESIRVLLQTLCVSCLQCIITCQLYIKINMYIGSSCDFSVDRCILK